MKFVFASCLLAAAASAQAAATVVTTDEYSFSLDAPMGATTQSTATKGFGEEFVNYKYAAKLEQMSDHKVKITKTITVTMKSDVTASADNEGEVAVCSADGKCDYGSFTSTKLKLSYFELSAKPTAQAQSPKVQAGPQGAPAVNPIIPAITATDCAKITDYTFSSSTMATPDTSTNPCKKNTPSGITYKTPTFEWTLTEEQAAGTEVAAKKVLSDFKTAASTMYVAISFANATEREIAVFDQAAVLKVVAAPATIAGADMMATTMTMAIALSAAAALF